MRLGRCARVVTEPAWAAAGAAVRQGSTAESRKDEQAGSENRRQHVSIAMLHWCFLRLRTVVVVGGLVSWFFDCDPW
jgi:hypothetical protein